MWGGGGDALTNWLFVPFNNDCTFAQWHLKKLQSVMNRNKKEMY
jgi:hypothetical protein